jgi:hypothetical protein
VSGSITMTSAGEPARSDPPGSPNSSAGRVVRTIVGGRTVYEHV